MATWLLIERTPESDFARLIKTRSLGAFHQRRDDLEDLGRVLEQHQIQPVIDSAFSFEEANAAFNHYAGRKVTGKVVIRH
ncbi:MAG TPA: zinc-binding dehydrogenase [Bryobacteraceae bacterium]|nr:zinc-binding dehydrogenase [Bryobacteraceae bacterium]